MLHDMKRSVSSAFTLVEIVMALGLCSFCLVALLGLFSVGLKIEQDGTAELGASHLLQSLIATRRAAPAADLSSTKFPLPALTAGTNVPPTTVIIDASGNLVNSASDPNARYALHYQVDAPAAPKFAPFRVSVCLTWPPAASRSNALGSLEQTTNLPRK